MTDLRKAAEMALEAMDNEESPTYKQWYGAIEALRQALAQPEQRGHCTCGDPTILGYVHFRTRPCIYYTAPPKREWVGLTDEEARDISFNLPIKWTGHLQGAASIYDFARAIEAKLKEKNT